LQKKKTTIIQNINGRNRKENMGTELKNDRKKKEERRKEEPMERKMYKEHSVLNNKK
jgi:hypothetical protein